MRNNNKFYFDDFVFLNTDFLESFIAQKYKGFPKEMQDTESSEHTDDIEGERVEKETTIGGKIGTSSLGTDGSYKTRRISEQINEIDTKSTQNVILKVQKDNMYRDFFFYLRYNDLLADSSSMVSGKYIKLYDVFYFIDFDRIIKICDTYESVTNNNGQINGITNEEIQKIKNKANLLKEMIPFDALLYNEQVIVLIDKKWLRVQKDHLGYILNGEITIVGKINKVLEMNNTVSVPNVINMLNKMQEYAMSLLYDLGLLNSDKVKIVTPIAIYH